jgi:hypothetical protein
MSSIFKIFQELKNQSLSNSDNFNIASLPLVQNHKIGISNNNQPIFFIKCVNSTDHKSLDCNLEFISVLYNRECQLLIDNKKIDEGIYTIVSLKTDSIDLQEYFLEVVYLVIKKLPPIPKPSELKVEVEKLINLFSKFSNPPFKTIQGLWAELLVIEQSRNPQYLIKAWHKVPFDKFDFNDGKDKIEVKSTSKNRRVHSFSVEQLNPNPNSELIIASVFTVETGLGKNIFDLVSMIEEKINDEKLVFLINDMLAYTLGNDIERSFETFFDYALSVDTLKFFDSNNIPRFRTKYIPGEIFNVRFDCDLTDVKGIRTEEMKSILHRALII